MSNQTDVDESDLSDTELTELIKRHGIDRRTVMKSLGIGTMLSLGVGNAAAKHDDPHPPRIDARYGYAMPDATEIPRHLEPDHEVELHIGNPTPGEHSLLFHFEPTGLHVEAGDIVQFTFTTPDHTITAYHPEHGFQRRIPEGATPFSSPVGGGGSTWLYRFEEEGLYDAYCAPHHILGMVIRIVVGDLEEVPVYEDTFQGSEEPPLLPPFSKEFLEHELELFSADDENENPEWVWLTPQEVLDADALDPSDIQAEGAVPFDAVLEDIDRIDGGHH